MSVPDAAASATTAVDATGDAHSSQLQTWWARLLAPPVAEVAIVLLALCVRLWRLTYHSVWFDEAVSLRWARSDAAWIWVKTFPLQEDKHPPGYYLYLHVWNNVLEWLGQDKNDWLLRASGVALGVLTVVGLLLLVRALSGRRIALLAALFAAVSPVLVWYSQELRMFQPATTLAVWAAYLLLAAWRREIVWQRLLLWAGMAAALVAGAYAYLFSAFLYPAAGFATLALLQVERGASGRRRWGRLIEAVAALAVAGALFLPLARKAWLVNNAESTPGAPFAGFAQALWNQVRIFTIWRLDWPALEMILLVVAGALMVYGLLAPGKRRGSVERMWLWIWLFTPLLIGGALLATTDSVFGEDRYFLFVAPFACWALARGVVLLATSPHRSVRILGWSAGASMIVALTLALAPLWSPSHARENWRAAIATIVAQQAARPEMRTAVISHIDYTHLPAEWYLRQHYTFDELPLYFPFGGALDASMIDAVIAPPLAGVKSAGFETLWLLQSHLEGMDDAHLVEGWLAERYPLIAEQFPGGIRQTAYAIRSRYAQLPSYISKDEYVDAELAPNLILAACEVTTPDVSATDVFLHPPSGRVHVRLWWRSPGNANDGYTPQVRVVNQDGVWGEIVEREGDALRMIPPSTWQPDEYIRHEVDVALNPVTPDGDYAVTVALLDTAGNATRAPVVCGTVQIQ